jgi:hypothetical protein
MVPLVGLKPMIPLNNAGTRIEPAVSLPRENDTKPSLTVTALPELDPPTM